MQGCRVGDALVDPHQTIQTPVDPLKKDPGYFELRKRSTRIQDLSTKEIKDHQGRNIFKVDENYGKKNGGLICQSTFNHGATSNDSHSAFKSTASEVMSPAASSIKMKELQEQKLRLLREMQNNNRDANKLINTTGGAGVDVVEARRKLIQTPCDPNKDAVKLPYSRRGSVPVGPSDVAFIL